MPKLRRLILFLLMSVFLTAAGGGENLAAPFCGEPVFTLDGKIKGKPSPDSASCAYLGVPYAGPPVGENRWKPPARLPPRGQTFEAFEFGADCVQSGRLSPLLGGGRAKRESEDCLFLNIWRPAKPGEFPVMVWIHGGGFAAGSGSRPGFRGDRLAAARDVVVVSLNYRLGAFGFLAHPAFETEDPDGGFGNYGLLDQIAALSWVRDNIAGFGGDPGTVTIFGVEAGGSSVCALLASPVAAGFFQRAIVQSGSCAQAFSREEGFRRGEAIARELGCEGEKAAACLRGKSTGEINREATGRKGFNPLNTPAFMPHVDGRVLMEVPLEAIRKGAVAPAPVMVGSTRDEAKAWMASYPGARLAPSFAADRYVTGILGRDAGEGLDDYYSLRRYLRPADRAIAALGDLAVGCPCFELARAWQRVPLPVYYYRFDYDDHLYSNLLGAAQGLELPFIFDSFKGGAYPSLFAPWQIKKALPLSEIMMSFWANFAKRGDPNEDGLPEWPAYDSVRFERMHLGSPSFSLHTGNVETCRFWRKLGEDGGAAGDPDPME